MKVAVTGANGHIGVNVCKELLAKGHQVCAFYHNNKSSLKSLDLNLIQGSILDQEKLEYFAADHDAFIHLAAKISIDGDPDGSVYETNALGTKTVLQACIKAKIKRFIHMSSIHTFDMATSSQCIDETSPVASMNGSAYDRSKLMADMAVLEANKNGLPSIILCPTSVVGPFDFQPSLTGKVLLDLQKGKIPMLVKGGFDWVDVRDVAQATVAALTSGERGEKYILSGHWASLRELSELAAQQTGIAAPRIEVPIWLAMVGVPFAKAYAKLTNTRALYTKESLMTLKNCPPRISSEKAKEAFGYSSRPLETTIRDTYEWFSHHNSPY